MMKNILLIVLCSFSLCCYSNSVTIGSGSGNISINDAFTTYSLNTGDTVFINSSTGNGYGVLDIRNNNRRLYVIGIGTVVFNYGGNNINSELNTNISLNLENMTFRNGNFRGITVFGRCDSLTLKNIRIRQISDYAIIFNGLAAYNGTNTTRRDNITLDGVTIDSIANAPGIVLPRAYGLEIKNCSFDSSFGTTQNLFELYFCKGISIHDNTFTKINIGGTSHNSIMEIKGSGKVYNNNVNGFQGDFIRGRAYTCDPVNANDIDNLLVYNNFAWNSTKYSFMEFQMFGGDTTSGASYGSNTVHSAKFKAFNNSAGRLRDLDFPGGGSMFILFAFSRSDHEIKNNAIWFPRTDVVDQSTINSQITAIFNNSAGSIGQVDTSNNRFYKTWQQLADSVNGNLLSNSELIDAGVTVSLFNTDYLGTTRPQGAAWDIGRNEFITVSNLPPTANAGSDQIITLPTSQVTLSGSGNDPDGTITAYAWTKVSGPVGNTITSPTSASTTVTGLVQGVYVFRLTVTDNSSDTGFDDVQVTVNAAGVPPTNRSRILRVKRK